MKIFIHVLEDVTILEYYKIIYLQNHFSNDSELYINIQVILLKLGIILFYIKYC